MTNTRLSSVLLAALWSLAGCVAPDAKTVRPTFAREIAPIVYAHCASCHRPGEAGPFSLLSYEDVRRRAALVADVVSRRYMPPWMPEGAHGEFVGDRRLTDAQVALIEDWVRAGAPAGDGDPPPLPTFPGGWQLGEPDLVVTVPTPYPMPAEGPDQFRTFLIPVSLAETRFVRAVEFRPGNARAVHHAVLRVARAGTVTTSQQISGEEAGDGMLSTEEFIASPDGHLLGWAPGYSPNVAPPDMPWPLEPRTALAIEVHLQSTGKVEDVRPSVGLFFTDRAPSRRPFGLQLGSYTIDIPPGGRDYVIEDRYTLPVDVELQAVYPHAHYLGKDLRAWATLPDGSERSLIRIPNWDFNWQNAYRYATAVSLPKGTTIAMRYVYDNSAENPRNPSHPPRRVRYGGQSSDEMGNLWLQVVPPTPADRALLQSDYAVHSAERQIEGYEHLLAERPDDGRVRRALADAHNFRGVTFAQRGQSAEAARAYRRAIAIWPSHAAAHSNLGSVLRELGRGAEAVREYRAAISSDPEFADAHFNLGLMLQQAGRTEEAAAHFRRAVAGAPDAPEPLNALAWLLATDARATPDTRQEGVELAKRAVQLTAEADASALDTLAAAYAAVGEFDRATALADRAWRLAAASGRTRFAAEIEARLALYREQRAYRR